MTLANRDEHSLSNQISPAMFKQGIEEAQAKAQALSNIVESQGLYNKIGGGKHLRVEAWQTIAMGYGLTPAITGSQILYNHDNEEYGAMATAVVYDQNGVIRGGAEGYCMRDEANWRSKPSHQLVSMAGTRAVSKALRLMLSWVVVLAGYDATPAEELTSSERVDSQPKGKGKGRQQESEHTKAVKVLAEKIKGLDIQPVTVTAMIQNNYNVKRIADLTLEQLAEVSDWTDAFTEEQPEVVEAETPEDAEADDGQEGLI